MFNKKLNPIMRIISITALACFIATSVVGPSYAIQRPLISNGTSEESLLPNTVAIVRESPIAFEFKDAAEDFEGVDLEHFVCAQHRLIEKDLSVDELINLLSFLGLYPGLRKDKAYKKIYETLCEIGYTKEVIDLINAGTYQDPRLDIEIIGQNPNPRAQSVFEAVANSLDALGFSIGQFGKGVKQIIDWLESTGIDRIDVYTKEKNGKAYQLTILRSRQGQNYISIRKISDDKFSEATKAAIKYGTAVCVKTKNKIPATADQADERHPNSIESMTKGLRTRFCYTTAAELFVNGEKVNGFSNKKVIVPEGSPGHTASESAGKEVRVNIDDNGIMVLDNGKGMDPEIVSRMFVPKQGTKHPEPLDEAQATKELDKVKVIHINDINFEHRISFSRNSETIVAVDVPDNIDPRATVQGGLMMEFGRILGVPESRDSIIIPVNMEPGKDSNFTRAVKYCIEKIIAHKELNNEEKVKYINTIIIGLDGIAQENDKYKLVIKNLRAWAQAELAPIITRLRSDGFVILPHDKKFAKLAMPEGKKPIFLHEKLFNWEGAVSLQEMGGLVLPLEAKLPIVVIPFEKSALGQVREFDPYWYTINEESRIPIIKTDRFVAIPSQFGRRLYDLAQKRFKGLDENEKKELDHLIALINIITANEVKTSYGMAKHEDFVRPAKSGSAIDTGNVDSAAVNDFLAKPPVAISMRPGVPSDAGQRFALLENGDVVEIGTGKRALKGVEKLEYLRNGYYKVTINEGIDDIPFIMCKISKIGIDSNEIVIESTPRFLKISPDKRFVYEIQADGRLRDKIIDMATGNVYSLYNGMNNMASEFRDESITCTNLQFSADGKYMTYLKKDNETKQPRLIMIKVNEVTGDSAIRDTEKIGEMRFLGEFEYAINPFANMVFVCNKKSDTMKLIDLETGSSVATAKDIKRLHTDPSGQYTTIFHADGTMDIYHHASKKLKDTCPSAEPITVVGTRYFSASSPAIDGGTFIFTGGKTYYLNNQGQLVEIGVLPDDSVWFAIRNNGDIDCNIAESNMLPSYIIRQNIFDMDPLQRLDQKGAYIDTRFNLIIDNSDPENPSVIDPIKNKKIRYRGDIVRYADNFLFSRLNNEHFFSDTQNVMLKQDAYYNEEPSFCVLKKSGKYHISYYKGRKNLSSNQPQIDARYSRVSFDGKYIVFIDPITGDAVYLEPGQDAEPIFVPISQPELFVDEKPAGSLFMRLASSSEDNLKRFDIYERQDGALCYSDIKSAGRDLIICPIGEYSAYSTTDNDNIIIVKMPQDQGYNLFDLSMGKFITPVTADHIEIDSTGTFAIVRRKIANSFLKVINLKTGKYLDFKNISASTQVQVSSNENFVYVRFNDCEDQDKFNIMACSRDNYGEMFVPVGELPEFWEGYDLNKKCIMRIKDSGQEPELIRHKGSQGTYNSWYSASRESMSLFDDTVIFKSFDGDTYTAEVHDLRSGSVVTYHSISPAEIKPLKGGRVWYQKDALRCFYHVPGEDTASPVLVAQNGEYMLLLERPIGNKHAIAVINSSGRKIDIRGIVPEGFVHEGIIGGHFVFKKDSASMSSIPIDQRATAVAFSQDNKLLATGDFDGEIKIRNRKTGECLKTLKVYDESILKLTFAPGKSTIISYNRGNSIKIWDYESGNLVREYKIGDNTKDVTFCPDGSMFAIAVGKSVKIYNSQTGQCFREVNSIVNKPHTFAFSPDGSQLVVAGDDNIIDLWDIQTGVLRQTLLKHTGPVDGLAFSPDGKTLASSSSDKTIIFWDMQTARYIKKLNEGGKLLAFSPDGKTLATASGRDRKIIIWDTQTTKPIKALIGHSSTVEIMAFSPDGDMLVSAGMDNKVNLWDFSMPTKYLDPSRLFSEAPPEESSREAKEAMKKQLESWKDNVLSRRDAWIAQARKAYQPLLGLVPNEFRNEIENAVRAQIEGFYKEQEKEIIKRFRSVLKDEEIDFESVMSFDVFMQKMLLVMQKLPAYIDQNKLLLSQEDFENQKAFYKGLFENLFKTCAGKIIEVGKFDDNLFEALAHGWRIDSQEELGVVELISELIAGLKQVSSSSIEISELRNIIGFLSQAVSKDPGAKVPIVIKQLTKILKARDNLRVSLLNDIRDAFSAKPNNPERARAFKVFLTQDVELLWPKVRFVPKGKNIKMLTRSGAYLSQILKLEKQRKKSGKDDVIMDIEYLIEHLQDLPPRSKALEAEILFYATVQAEPGASARETAQNSMDATAGLEGELVVDFYTQNNRGKQEYVEEAADNGTGALKEVALLIPISPKARHGQVDITGFFGRGKYTIFEGADRVEIITKNKDKAFMFTYSVKKDNTGQPVSVRLTGIRSIDDDRVIQGVIVRRIKKVENTIPELDAMLSRRAWKTFSGLCQNEHFKIYFLDHEGNKQPLIVEKEVLSQTEFKAVKPGQSKTTNFGTMRIISARDMPLQVVDKAGLKVSKLKDEYLALIPHGLRNKIEQLGIIIQIPLPLIGNRSSFEHEKEHLPAIQKYVAIEFYKAIAYKAITQKNRQFLFEGFSDDWDTNPKYLEEIDPALNEGLFAIAQKINKGDYKSISRQDLDNLIGQKGVADTERKLLRLIFYIQVPTDQNNPKIRTSLLDCMIAVQERLKRRETESLRRSLADRGHDTRSVAPSEISQFERRVSMASTIGDAHMQLRNIENYIVQPQNQAEIDLLSMALSAVGNLGVLGITEAYLTRGGVLFNGGFTTVRGKRVIVVNRELTGSVGVATETIDHEIAHLLEDGVKEQNIGRLIDKGYVAHQSAFTHDPVGPFRDAMQYGAWVWFANQKPFESEPVVKSGLLSEQAEEECIIMKEIDCGA